MDSFTIKGQSGVQMLLSAEQEAQQIVSSARSLKMTRLKQAKDEADREIALYRTQMDKEFQNKISESTGNSGATVKRLEEETELKIKSLNDKSSKVSKEVVGMIKRYVTTVKN